MSPVVSGSSRGTRSCSYKSDMSKLTAAQEDFQRLSVFRLYVVAPISVGDQTTKIRLGDVARLKFCDVVNRAIEGRKVESHVSGLEYLARSPSCPKKKPERFLIRWLSTSAVSIVTTTRDRLDRRKTRRSAPRQAPNQSPCGKPKKGSYEIPTRPR